MKAEDTRICPGCGREFSAALKFCPVCMLHEALASDVESGETCLEPIVAPISQAAAYRFEHYELVMGEDGKPVELGRGAIGGYLQSVRHRPSMPRDIESYQREVSR
jgi:hypothetical protein